MSSAKRARILPGSTRTPPKKVSASSTDEEEDWGYGTKKATDMFAAAATRGSTLETGSGGGAGTSSETGTGGSGGGAARMAGGGRRRAVVGADGAVDDRLRKTRDWERRIIPSITEDYEYDTYPLTTPVPLSTIQPGKFSIVCVPTEDMADCVCQFFTSIRGIYVRSQVAPSEDEGAVNATMIHPIRGDDVLADLSKEAFFNNIEYIRYWKKQRVVARVGTAGKAAASDKASDYNVDAYQSDEPFAILRDAISDELAFPTETGGMLSRLFYHPELAIASDDTIRDFFNKAFTADELVQIKWTQRLLSGIISQFRGMTVKINTTKPVYTNIRQCLFMINTWKEVDPQIAVRIYMALSDLVDFCQKGSILALHDQKIFVKLVSYIIRDLISQDDSIHKSVSQVDRDDHAREALRRKTEIFKLLNPGKQSHSRLGYFSGFSDLF